MSKCPARPTAGRNELRRLALLMLVKKFDDGGQHSETQRQCEGRSRLQPHTTANHLGWNEVEATMRTLPNGVRSGV